MGGVRGGREEKHFQTPSLPSLTSTTSSYITCVTRHLIDPAGSTVAMLLFLLTPRCLSEEEWWKENELIEPADN